MKNEVCLKIKDTDDTHYICTDEWITANKDKLDSNICYTVLRKRFYFK